MKIAYILFTNGLEYDDRIRKEMMSMKDVVEDIEFKVFSFHADNHAETGVLSYGVPFELVSIKHRGGDKGFVAMLKKEYDFYSQIKPKVKDYDLLWLCDEHPFFFTLFSHKPIIWDLHEIPAKLSGTSLKNKVFNLMERNCGCLIHANKERLDYLLGRGVIKKPSKNYVLRNYPDQNWILGKDQNSETFLTFKKWLGDEDYIYIQGLNGNDRFSYETLASVLEAKRIKAVVLGKVAKEVKEAISEKYPSAEKVVYYAGQVVQSETAPFIAHSKFSMVFYSINIPNNRYCEPNRMFQCLGMGKPVIVGCNEPMKSVVSQYENGIALETDGSKIEENIHAINQMMDNYEDYRLKAETHKNKFCWEAQRDVFVCLLENVFKKK